MGLLDGVNAPPVTPLVSIVVPSFNQGAFIHETITSILAQDYASLEVIVMDGGSTDDTIAILSGIRDARLRWSSGPDGGVVDAVNKGLAAARGAILSIQSSDDVFAPGAVNSAVDALLREPHVGLVYGDVALIDHNSDKIGEDVQGPFDLDLLLGRLAYIPQPGTFFTRAALTRAGAWRPHVSYVADADLWIRIALDFPVRKLNRVLAGYRYHDAQRDKHRMRILQDWETMVADLAASGRLDPRRLRFAHMGIFLARYRYLDSEQWWRRTKSLYRAAIANPGSVLDPRFPRRDLLPGRQPIWRTLSRVKRRLGLPAR